MISFSVIFLVQAFNTKVVTYRTGNDFYMSSEAMLFGKDSGAIFLYVLVDPFPI